MWSVLGRPSRLQKHLTEQTLSLHDVRAGHHTAQTQSQSLTLSPTLGHHTTIPPYCHTAQTQSQSLALTLHPPPPQDYWLSLLFKRLVGQRVLAVQVAGLQRRPRPGRVIRDKLRIYAHCTSSRRYTHTQKDTPHTHTHTHTHTCNI